MLYEKALKHIENFKKKTKNQNLGENGLLLRQCLLLSSSPSYQFQFRLEQVVGVFQDS